MSSFSQVHNILLKNYTKYMLLNVFVDSNDDELKNKYINAANEHNNKFFNGSKFIDAGFDLFSPLQMNYGYDKVNKLDLNVVCSAIMFTDTNKSFNTGYYMYPRSSLSKTQLRLANATGIIDAGYRGHLMSMFDVVNIEHEKEDVEADYFGNKFDRYIQICAPGLVPILVEVVNTKEELGEQTERGDGGFGSTGR
jgi:dUTP pyrophosphatase